MRVVAWLRRRRLEVSVALVAYLPIVLSSPGAVGADTKTYLYLDPGRVLREASTMWDSDVALGTVTHQNIGYLWPMGPFYWMFDMAGLPDWFAQRIWLGTLLFAAGMGVRFLLRTLDWQGPGLAVAVYGYVLSPYLLDYSARISAVLLPWAGLPWMLAFTIRAARRGGWVEPARFALVVLTVGSVNATSLLLVGLAPVLWLVHAVVVERTLVWRQAMASAVRIGALTAGVSLWWVAGLVIQSGYSLPVTRYTETYEAVADASTAPEILRGLGYWFFYGNDKFGQWIEPSVEYTQGVWLLFLTFGLVVLALVSATLVRWRHRSFFLLLLVTGALIGIGAHPFDAPSPLGSLFEGFTRTDAGLALRSTPRAVPLVVLSTSVLLGTGVAAVSRRFARSGRVFGSLVLAAIILANPAMWRVRMIEEHLQRPEQIPDYWTEAAAAFDAGDDGTRVWELPGSDFASYRWGNTVDPITPGLIDRGYVARELVPFGSPESADVLTAFDRRLQEGSLDPEAVAPVARLLSVGEVVHRADLTYERFRTPRPQPTEQFLASAPGLGAAVGFGPIEPNVAGPEQTLRDEVALSIDPDAPVPAPVTARPVDDPLAVVRLRSTSGAQVLVGDGEGLVSAAAAGVFDPDRTLFYGADLVADPALATEVLADPAEIVVTDSNRRRARRWGTLRENVGATELAGQTSLRYDPTDNRLELFSALEDVDGLDRDDSRTVAIHEGAAAVVASGYGNPVTYTRDNRAVLAFDGDLATAWSVGDFAEARGELLRVEFTEPTSVDRIRVVQPQRVANRHITALEIRSDDGGRIRVALTAESWTAEGEVVTFPAIEGRQFDVVLTDLDVPVRSTYPVGISPVGFAELRLGNQGPITEWIRLPRALNDVLGSDLDRHSLTVIMERERSNPQEPVRAQPERTIRRLVPLATDRSFEVSGTVRLDPTAAPAALDAFLGRSAGLTLTSTGSLPGNLRAMPGAALDGDPTTAFLTPFERIDTAAWRVRTDRPVDVDGIEVDVLVDADRSVPTSIAVQLDDVAAGTFPTGLGITDAPAGSTVTVRLPVTADGVRSVRLEMAETDARLTRDWYSNAAVAMPIGLAEIRVGGLALGSPTDVATSCTTGLVVVDGHDVPVRISGDAEVALRGGPLRLEGCEAVETITGDVPVVASPGALPVLVDRLVLTSPRPVEGPAPLPRLETSWHSDVRATVTLPSGGSDDWLVLGQSHNDGWHASVDGVDLGPPVLIDGFANGWRIPDGATTVELEWTPQRLVRRAILVSMVAIALTLALAFRRSSGADRLVAPAGPPRLIDSWASAADVSVPRRVASAAALGVGVFAAVNLASWSVTAVVVAATVFVALHRGAMARLPAAAATVVFAVASLGIMAEQTVRRFPPDFGWPGQFERYHVLGVLTVLFVAAEVVATVVRPGEPS